MLEVLQLYTRASRHTLIVFCPHCLGNCIRCTPHVWCSKAPPNSHYLYRNKWFVVGTPQWFTSKMYSAYHSRHLNTKLWNKALPKYLGFKALSRLSLIGQMHSHFISPTVQMYWQHSIVWLMGWLRRLQWCAAPKKAFVPGRTCDAPCPALFVPLSLVNSYALTHTHESIYMYTII